MDVTPPGAAGTASRPSRTTPSGIPLVLRRLAIGLAGAALAVLAGVACALSFDDLRALAVSGRAEPRLAYLYPAAFDVLLVVALVSVPLLRTARFLVRLQAGFVLILLLVSAAAANAATAAGVSFDPDVTALVVALLPWVMLAVGLWLLLLLLKHVRTSRADLDGDTDDDLVPFDGEREPRTAATAPYPVAVRERPAPAHALTQDHGVGHEYGANQEYGAGREHAVTQEHGAPPLQPVPEAVAPPDYVPPLPVSPVSETVAPPEYAPPLPVTPPQNEDEAAPSDPDEDGVRRPHVVSGETTPAAEPQTTGQTTGQATDEAETLPVVPPTAAPGTPPVTEPAPRPAPRADAEPVTEPVTEPMAEPTADAVADETATDEHARDAEPADTPAAPTPDTETHAETPAAPTPDTGTDASADASADAEKDDRPAPQPRRNRPVRWGDLVRPHTGDVLVHPRPKPEDPADIEADRPEDESGVDTQPLRQIRDVPDPAHAQDSADPDEVSGRLAPQAAECGDQDAAEEAGEGNVPLAPPSGRMRSTPRPPA
ncbi:DUF2637 domain-containing protein [Microbispora sp. NPDC049633]|uniref:DUF2637 domain-containing protein n=1 Tax=Microbispora sp. NPDC049633 TaxID=3154355 RepID=UPI00341FD6D1